MKKSSIRNLFFSLLVLTSLGSFVYINSVQVPEDQPKCNKLVEEAETEEDQSEMLLPEVQLVKKILEKGKEMLPATHF